MRCHSKQRKSRLTPSEALMVNPGTSSSAPGPIGHEMLGCLDFSTDQCHTFDPQSGALMSPLVTGAVLVLVGVWMAAASRARSKGRIYQLLLRRPSMNPWIRNPHVFLWISGLAMAALGFILMLRGF